MNVENQYCKYYSLIINLHIFLKRTLCTLQEFELQVKKGKTRCPTRWSVISITTIVQPLHVHHATAPPGNIKLVTYADDSNILNSGPLLKLNLLSNTWQP